VQTRRLAVSFEPLNSSLLLLAPELRARSHAALRILISVIGNEKHRYRSKKTYWSCYSCNNEITQTMQ